MGKLRALYNKLMRNSIVANHSKKKDESRYLVASPWQLVRWKFVRHKIAMVALVILIGFFFAVIFAEFVAPYDPREFQEDLILAPPQRIRFVDDSGHFYLRPFVYPLTKQRDPNTYQLTYTENRQMKQFLRLFVRGTEYKLWNVSFLRSDVHLFGIDNGILSPLGKDALGRDLLSRIIFGARVSMTVPLVAISVSFTLGILIGGISGYLGGRIDAIIQRIIEAIRSIPTIPLWMALSVSLPRNWPVTRTFFAISMILAIWGWTGIARVVRGKFLAVRTEDFIMAAELDGASRIRIIFRYLLPSFLSYIIARLTLEVPNFIIGETALSFIGVGMQAPGLSWGVLLKDAQHIRILADAPWILIPGLFVFLAVICYNFVGDGLRDAADPYTSV